MKPFFEQKDIRLAAIIALLYIAVNSAMIAYEQFWFSLIPMVLMLAILIILALDKTLIFITFVTPLAVNISSFDVGVGISLPSEPILILLSGIIVFKFFLKDVYKREFLTHPITIAILFYLLWIAITTTTSELPLVSFKFLLAKLWFIIPFYFFGFKVFQKNRNILLYIWAYVISLIIVIIYTLINHALNGFTDKSAHWVMTPFYNDHTAYGAALAMYIPIIFGLIFWKNYSRFKKMLTAFVFIVLMVAIVFSISRAAWASVAAAVGIYILLKFRIKLSWMVMAAGVLLILFFSFQDQILMKLEKNKQDSSDNFAEHVQSMSNIATDASNLERLNRWHSAFRLFNERPFVGWGPGTYQFVYAPFQSSEDLTIISTNAGNKGTAHSEYFGPLCEQGVPGVLSYVLILSLMSFYAIRVYRTSKNKEDSYLALLLFLGMITYVAHGAFNNFLDSDKLSVPFWGMLAAIVALDLKNRPERKELN